jgi:hypothetical protein
MSVDDEAASRYDRVPDVYELSGVYSAYLSSHRTLNPRQEAFDGDVLQEKANDTSPRKNRNFNTVFSFSWPSFGHGKCSLPKRLHLTRGITHTIALYLAFYSAYLAGLWAIDGAAWMLLTCLSLFISSCFLIYRLHPTRFRRLCGQLARPRHIFDALDDSRVADVLLAIGTWISNNIIVDMIRYFEPKKTLHDLAATVRRMRLPHLAFNMEGRSERRSSLIAPSAGQLLRIAANLLPADHRLRFTEEFRSELWQVAHAGGGRLQQLRYAFQQVIRAPFLRHALLAPNPRNASP